MLCIGGDGTLRGAQEIAKEAQKRGLNTAVVAIPKTIDNDVMYISRTFGMITATEKAHEILASSWSNFAAARNNTRHSYNLIVRCLLAGAENLDRGRRRELGR